MNTKYLTNITNILQYYKEEATYTVIPIQTGCFKYLVIKQTNKFNKKKYK